MEVSKSLCMISDRENMFWALEVNIMPDNGHNQQFPRRPINARFLLIIKNTYYNPYQLHRAESGFPLKSGKERIKKKKRQVELGHMGNWPEYQEFDYVYILYLSILIYIFAVAVQSLSHM